MAPVRVTIAPRRFAGTLTATAAAQAVAAGWERHTQDDELDICPLSDGGPGFLEAVSAALPGRSLAHRVPGVTGEPVTGVTFLTEGADGVLVAYVESAQVCGPVPAGRADLGRGTSQGLGVLIGEAVAAGARRVVVGLGGVASHDGGAGMLAGLAARLGVEDAGELAPLLGGGSALRGVESSRLGALAGLCERLAAVDLLVAGDLDVPLLGFKGVSALYAERNGATPEQAQELDLALADLARAALEATGRPQRLVAEPGAGAAGGLGFGLSLLGARREPGASVTAAAVGLSARLEGCGLVVTGEGCLDWASLRGSVLTAVAALAQPLAVPVVSVAGQVQVGRRELLSIGVESAYPVARTADEVAAAMAEPAARLADRAERVARTWSPRR